MKQEEEGEVNAQKGKGTCNVLDLFVGVPSSLAAPVTYTPHGG